VHVVRESETWVQLSDGLTGEQAAELGLVLEASRIEHRLVSSPRGRALIVPRHYVALAVEQLQTYQRENAGLQERPPPPSLLGAGWPGVILYAGLLMIIAVCVRQYVFGLDWLGAGRMDAAGLRAGQLWRVVTALTVHLDLDHLAANLAFGGFFAYFVARYFGAGLGWLAILLSGAVGNLLNGLLQSPDHRSIGASTAVFGALALLTVMAWRHGLWSATTWRARTAPLVAGVALLAYTGTGGENTDIGAHLTGFIAGFGIGWVIVDSRLMLRGPTLQRNAARMTALILGGAWLIALAVSG